MIAAGTTVVRALETVTDAAASCTPATGWTELVVTPERGCARSTVCSPAGTSPRRRTCSMLEAIAGPARARAPRTPRRTAAGYLWHEFGDSHLLLAGRVRDERRPRRAAMPDGRRAVLYALRRRGEATADDIAAQLDMTVSGARQHLDALVEDGFAEAGGAAAAAPGSAAARSSRTPSPTRPTRLFPKAYGELTNELLGYASEADAACIDTLFERRRDERIRNATARLGAKPDARRRRSPSSPASSTRTATSRRSKRSTPGLYRIVEHNCAIWAVAQRYGQACSSEIEFIRAVLPEADVERVQHMVAGAPHCAYEVRAKAVQQLAVTFAAWPPQARMAPVAWGN